MSKQILRTPDAPSSPLFSQGVKIGQMIYVSGMTGMDPQTSKMAGPTIQEQTRQAIKNCESVLQTGGAGLGDVVNVLVLLARPEDFAGMNEEYGKAFAIDPPARAVSRLGVEVPGLLVSVVMVAAVG